MVYETGEASEGKKQTMKKEDEQLGKIKKIKILDFLVFFGDDKIGFKVTKYMKHFTMQFLEDGIVDLHETTERKEKTHHRIGRLDLKKLSEAVKEMFEKELPSVLKGIDIDNSKYHGISVVIVPTKEELRKKVQVKHRGLEIDKDRFNELACAVPMKELPNHDFRVAFWTEDNKECALYRIDGKYYSLQVDEFTKLLDKIPVRSFLIKTG